MGSAKWMEKLQEEKQETNKSTAAEFVLDQEKREELLVARIYRLSYLLSNEELTPEHEELVKQMLEDSLAELDTLNQQLFGKSKHRRLFH